MSNWNKMLTGMLLLSGALTLACSTDEDPTTSTPDEEGTDEPMEMEPDTDPPEEREPMVMEPMEPEPTMGSRLALKAYDVCEADEDCEGGLSCVDLLGSQVCSATGCGDDEDVCVEGETCVVSPAIAPDGVCAFTGTDQFCARNCRNPLVCNLDVECATQGCCGDVEANGCPAVCETLDEMNCEISPQCPVECCGGE